MCKLYRLSASLFLFWLAITGCSSKTPPEFATQTPEPPTPAPIITPSRTNSPTPTKVSLTQDPETTPAVETLPNSFYSLT
ncbi:MAG: hypothetical protein KAI94_04270, partial [Anaerolineales bacterium]|nr:hypothetical protein [Anaerolineales bacterium]